jgi:hypothetical protein
MQHALLGVHLASWLWRSIYQAACAHIRMRPHKFLERAGGNLSAERKHIAQCADHWLVRTGVAEGREFDLRRRPE